MKSGLHGFFSRSCGFLPVLAWLTVLGPAAAWADWETVRGGGMTSCALGTPYEFHVRRGDPTRMVMFFNGGGGCWSHGTCGNTAEGGTYVSSAQMEHNDPRLKAGIFDFENESNPVRDWTHVFVSYCTGDVHLGAAVRTYSAEGARDLTVRHLGRVNAQSALEWAARNMPHARHILVAGGSAGAMSAPFYATLIAEAWPQADITQFSGGAGSYLPERTVAQLENWGFFQGLPDWPELALLHEGHGWESFYGIAAARAPQIRLTRFDHLDDAMQARFLAFEAPDAEVAATLGANNARLAELAPESRVYLAPGSDHTLLRYDRTYSTEVNGVAAVDWLRARLAGDEVENVAP